MQTEEIYVVATAEAKFTTINIREEPDVTSPAIATTKPNTRFLKLAQYGKWVEVKVEAVYKGTKYDRGWIYADYITNE